MVEEIAQLRRQLRAARKRAQLADRAGVDPDEWVDTVKGPEKEPLRELINIIESEDTDMSDEDRGKAVRSLKDIAPPVADLVWRQLHPSIQKGSARQFKDGGCEALVDKGRRQGGAPTAQQGRTTLTPTRDGAQSVAETNQHNHSVTDVLKQMYSRCPET